jgi:sugar/nucleoside kinase (ribokinase family)
MLGTDVPHLVMVGTLCESYTITPNYEVFAALPGGSALTSAIGARLWTDRLIGLVARVGENYPQIRLEEMQEWGLDTRGVRVMPGSYPCASFRCYRSWDEYTDRDPVRQFARLEKPLPKALSRYESPEEGEQARDSFSLTAVRPTDFPADYRGTRGVHLAPGPLVTHLTLPVSLRQTGLASLTLDPSSRYMDPSLLGDLPTLLRGLTAFIVAERKALVLFREVTRDPREMAERLAQAGPHIIIIKRGPLGCWLFDSASQKHYQLPAYPVASPRNPAGVGDAFSGGFLAGWCEKLDPLEAALCGSVSASLAIEATGPWEVLRRSSGLAEARLSFLRSQVSAQ